MKCCMCGSSESPFLTPSQCLRKNGLEKSHKVCQTCWFRDFAKEGVSHRCPGCLKAGEDIQLRPQV